MTEGIGLLILVIWGLAMGLFAGYIAWGQELPNIKRQKRNECLGIRTGKVSPSQPWTDIDLSKEIDRINREKLERQRRSDYEKWKSIHEDRS